MKPAGVSVMESNSRANGLQNENSQGDFQLETIKCPNCKETVPKSIYCLKCGFPLYNLGGITEEVTIEVTPDPNELKYPKGRVEPSKDTLIAKKTTPSKAPLLDPGANLGGQRGAKSTTEASVEKGGHEHPAQGERQAKSGLDLEEPEDVEIDVDEELDKLELSPEVKRLERPRMITSLKEPIAKPVQKDPLMKGGREEPSCKPNDRITQLTKDLINSISLELWSINLLLEGKVKEDHFNKIFEGYLARSEECVKRRDEMLKRADDIGEIERALEEAKIGLGELEVRRSIGDLQEGEYDAKVPAFQWDIQHNEKELSKRKEEAAYLKDLTRVVPEDEIAKLKEMARKADGVMANLKKPGEIGHETAAKVEAALEWIISFLDDFKSKGPRTNASKPI
jgi:hypothetical protein